MDDTRYFGDYFRFDTQDKKLGSRLIGPDNVIGSQYQIEFQTEGSKTKAWLVNRFGDKVGFISARDSYRLNVIEKRGWKLFALLSLVGCTTADGGPNYWGEVAVVATTPRYLDIMTTYIGCLSKQLAEGTRPEVALKSQGIDTLISENGNWTSNKRRALPKKNKGTAFVKTKRSPSEAIIDKGRERNVGCYIVSWLFIAVLVVGVVAGLTKLLGIW